MKLNFKSNRKAFTLVELLIVIAIIGILFVVLVSKVDFATDKANATGVQTDFRSFQIAFETVSRENAGFNTLGWDTGDKADNSLLAGYTYENADKDGGDRIRNSYDKGDMNLNGICEDGETWTGQKLYTETWTGIYTLDNPADVTDMSAYLALEKAINKNLDPALQISMDPENKTVYMANGYQDPWKTEYHGFYLTNANGDGMDRGAIVIYSDGPNKIFGSEQTIAKGKVTVTVKNGGINGQDDMALVTCYTYMNGYGEVATMTEGFSNNQVFSGNGNSGVESMLPSEGEYQMLTKPSSPIKNTNFELIIRSEAPRGDFKEVKVNGNVVDPSNYIVTEGSTIITFKPEYLATLLNGNYRVEIVSDGGSAICTFAIQRCQHSITQREFYVNKTEGQHEKVTYCVDCGTKLGSEVVSCTSFDFCSLCGFNENARYCGHNSASKILYVAYDNFHIVAERCSSCSLNLNVTAEQCNIDDGQCTKCTYKVGETCSHINIKKTQSYIGVGVYNMVWSCADCNSIIDFNSNYCSHEDNGTATYYKYINTEQHEMFIVCFDCGQFSETEVSSHENSNICVCKYNSSSSLNYCGHNPSPLKYYAYTGSDSHVEISICDWCGNSINVNPTKCHSIVNGVCTHCKHEVGKNACEHVNIGETGFYLGAGTHCIIKYCIDCTSYIEHNVEYCDTSCGTCKCGKEYLHYDGNSDNICENCGENILM